ncbi:MarR family winged helix-turn-helix transcriptional regulator [Phreatobacter sp.]|uniref:MarR family winged helix-turn-helix transcriptional regulator n=1 Tax=Phreatobacter sp. TaxID=1966341 RepID=UPI003F6FA9C3
MDGRSVDDRGEGVRKLELEGFLPYRLNVLASTVSQALSGLYARRYGFGIPEWRIIATLGQFGTMTAKDIGGHSHMHKTKVSRAVASLTRRKLVTRRANRQDLRESFLALSPDGRAVYDDLVPVALDFEQSLLRGIATGDRGDIDALIGRLIARAEALLAETGGGEPE